MHGRAIAIENKEPEACVDNEERMNFMFFLIKSVLTKGNISLSKYQRYIDLSTVTAFFAI